MGGSISCWVIAIWVAAIGGAVGSFLNVVVYRLPAGMSLSHPGSHCPQCKRPIRWHDNVPVFGWLILRGRCRDCRARIPIRYPLVEGLVAAIFFTVAIAEGASGGANLPVRPLPVGDGVIYPALSSGELAGLVGWHLLLLCTLVASALIDRDGQRVPARLFLPGLLVGLAGSAIWPHLHPQAAAVFAARPSAGILDGLAGLALGAVLGAAGGWLLDRPAGLAKAWSAGLVGLYLGWQPAAVIVLAAIVCRAILRVLERIAGGRRTVGVDAWMAAWALVWISGWAAFARMLFHP